MMGCSESRQIESDSLCQLKEIRDVLGTEHHSLDIEMGQRGIGASFIDGLLPMLQLKKSEEVGILPLEVLEKSMFIGHASDRSADDLFDSKHLEIEQQVTPLHKSVNIHLDADWPLTSHANGILIEDKANLVNVTSSDQLVQQKTTFKIKNKVFKHTASKVDIKTLVQHLPERLAVLRSSRPQAHTKDLKRKLQMKETYWSKLEKFSKQMNQKKILIRRNEKKEKANKAQELISQNSTMFAQSRATDDASNSPQSQITQSTSFRIQAKSQYKRQLVKSNIVRQMQPQVKIGMNLDRLDRSYQEETCNKINSHIKVKLIHHMAYNETHVSNYVSCNSMNKRHMKVDRPSIYDVSSSLDLSEILEHECL